MRDYRISPNGKMFIMAPLMSKLVSDADFVEIESDTSRINEYNNIVCLMPLYLTSTSSSGLLLQECMLDDAEFYKTAFNLMSQMRHHDFPQFKPKGSLKGIAADWRDTETKGL